MLFRIYNSSSFDHAMTAANDDTGEPIRDLLITENNKSIKSLRDGVKTVRRAPPPRVKHTEEEVKLFLMQANNVCTVCSHFATFTQKYY